MPELSLLDEIMKAMLESQLKIEQAVRNRYTNDLYDITDKAQKTLIHMSDDKIKEIILQLYELNNKKRFGD